jgi:hypothetical protein
VSASVKKDIKSMSFLELCIVNNVVEKYQLDQLFKKIV